MPTTSARLLALLSLLQSRRDWPGGLLAERLGISLRTIRRDVDRLRELGYPIDAVKGPDGGYRLSAGKDLPPLLFDDEQAVALVLALQVAGGEAATRALTTIRQVLPSRLRHRVEALRVTAVRRPAAEVDGELLLALSGAVHAREVLRFDYGDNRRRAEPHHVITRDGRWYLIAWDLDRDDWRTFRADRMTLRTPNGPRFTPRELPGGDVTGYVLGVFRGSTSGNWPCQGTAILGKPAAHIARFTHEGIVEELGPDRCRVTLGSWSWVSLAAAFARYDTDLEPVAPPELQAACTQLADRFRRAAGN
ncbi:YafY family protein [Actinoplanes sp. L3-i22]|uniref:helix-turn-helix transcriptional regulator n=1 Tax=Actinoplanes sp. L3-i22 TaxID=2836373 RepID=UPI001C78E0AC|nr:WYL domain-containing protein [Actinoplanes sp. L3-i22]BCY08194.1 DeoR family transcriptional regulator [Actinoplanes sp. L3-i22]